MMTPSANRKALAREEQRKERGVVVGHCLNFGELGFQSPVNLRDPYDVADRIAVFFKLCQGANIVPGVSTLCLCLGHGRDTILRWARRQVKNVPDDTARKLTEALEIIDAIAETRLRNGEIHPNTGIYLMRVAGFKDFNNDAEETYVEQAEKKTPEQIQAEYSDLPSE